MWDILINQFKNGVKVISNHHTGPRITLVASTHGDEISGLHVFRYLLEDFHIEQKLKTGTLQLVISNLEAAKQAKRFIDTDCNRVWDFTEKNSVTYEYHRAMEIAENLCQSDALLDIHSTTNPSLPMLIPADNITLSDPLLKAFVTPYIISNILPYLHGKALISYVAEKKPACPTIVIECGQHTDTKSITTAITNTLNFLAYFGMVENPTSDATLSNTKHLKVIDVIRARTMTPEFLYSKSPKSFDFIPRGTAIITDANTVLTLDEDCYLLMPCLPRYIGEEIGYICKSV